MTRQTSLQVNENTEQQAIELKRRGFGTFTDVVRTAVDRMFNQERDRNWYRVDDTDKTIEQLVEEWNKFEAKYQDLAPEAMLRWCHLAMNAEDELVKMCRPVVERAIVRRDLELFCARNDRETTEDDIRRECRSDIRNALMTAKFMSIMSAPMDD